MRYIQKDRRFGSNLKSIRKASGLTQDQTAARLQLRGFDISRSVYAQMECGIRNIHIEELVALKQIFGVSYDAFFAGFEEE